MISTAVIAAISAIVERAMTIPHKTLLIDSVSRPPLGSGRAQSMDNCNGDELASEIDSARADPSLSRDSRDPSPTALIVTAALVCGVAEPRNPDEPLTSDELSNSDEPLTSDELRNIDESSISNEL
jgi:hypothetical protein